MQEDTEVGQINAYYANLFESKQIRHNFIKKVYSLLTIQLLITCSIVAVFILHEGAKEWAQKTYWFSVTSFIVGFVVLLVIVCAGDIRRKHPHNLILLFAFTIAESFLISAISVMYSTTTLLMAAGITMSLCICLTLFAMQTKYDFTTKIGVMLVILLAMTFAIITYSFFPKVEGVTLAISVIMAVIMGIFLVIDTQMIVGGTHKIQMSPEEYIFATMNLYLDIINMFLYILSASSPSR